MAWLCIATLPAAISPSLAAAQDPSDSAAYRALIQTPLAAFAPQLGVAVTGLRPRGASVDLRYGLMSYDTHEYTHDFGATITLPMGGAALGITAGYRWPDCNGVCSGNFMAAADLSENLVDLPIGRGVGRGAFDVGLRLGAGFGRPSDATLYSGQLSIPVSLVPGPRAAIRLVPYVAPGIGVGMVHDASGNEAGLLFTTGAGVGLLTKSGFAATVGIRRAFLSTGNWLVGVGLTFGPSD